MIWKDDEYFQFDWMMRVCYSVRTIKVQVAREIYTYKCIIYLILWHYISSKCVKALNIEDFHTFWRSLYIENACYIWNYFFMCVFGWFQVTKDEISKLVKGFEREDLLTSGGVTLAGQRYIYLSGTDRVIRAKLGKVGVHCMKTQQGEFDYFFHFVNFAFWWKKLHYKLFLYPSGHSIYLWGPCSTATGGFSCRETWWLFDYMRVLEVWNDFFLNSFYLLLYIALKALELIYCSKSYNNT